MFQGTSRLFKGFLKGFISASGDFSGAPPVASEAFQGISRAFQEISEELEGQRVSSAPRRVLGTFQGVPGGFRLASEMFLGSQWGCRGVLSMQRKPIRNPPELP